MTQQLALDDAPVLARFMAKVRANPETGCWDWLAQTDRYGYGVIKRAGRMVRAHRTAYEFLNGPIPADLTVDHLCHNGTGCPGGTSCPHRACVNPAHLEAVAFGVNVLRGNGPSAKAARQTHCIHGHEFDRENTCLKKDGHRGCRACWRNTYHRRKSNNSASSVAAPRRPEALDTRRCYRQSRATEAAE